MTPSNGHVAQPLQAETLMNLCHAKWGKSVTVALERSDSIVRIDCEAQQLPAITEWLGTELSYAFATLVAEESPAGAMHLIYAYYQNPGSPWVFVEVPLAPGLTSLPSLSGLTFGPSVDWHEREVEDLFGLTFTGHPRLGEFVLHEDWPEGVNPMRRAFNAQGRAKSPVADPHWQPPTVVTAPGAFTMPIGPVFSDFAESAHFLLETVGEDVIHTIPRFFYKYRGVEKIAEGKPAERALLLAERFSGTSAFAHGLAFCQAVEAICGTDVPPRALALRVVFAELERMRHHAAAISGICNSTALAIAASTAALTEEELLRISCRVGWHRYLFGLVTPGGLACDLHEPVARVLVERVKALAERMDELHDLLRYSSSFLDRLEGVGTITRETAVSYGLVGPVARASGLSKDLRQIFPYAAYASVGFTIPSEQEGDGYARLRVLFSELQVSASIIQQMLPGLPESPICADPISWRGGTALAAVEAPLGAAFHWLRLREDGVVLRYRVTPPSFPNWHGFHLAAENFAFQDFPIILASFGLSNAESDR